MSECACDGAKRLGAAKWQCKEHGEQPPRIRCCRCFPNAIHEASGVCRCCGWNHVTRTPEWDPTDFPDFFPEESPDAAPPLGETEEGTT